MRELTRIWGLLKQGNGSSRWPGQERSAGRARLFHSAGDDGGAVLVPITFAGSRASTRRANCHVHMRLQMSRCESSSKAREPGHRYSFIGVDDICVHAIGGQSAIVRRHNGCIAGRATPTAR